jgi:hypothetical protein
MQTQGYLSAEQMGGAFEMLQSNDLVWSHAIRDYLLGEHDTPFDLMAWNADGTRHIIMHGQWGGGLICAVLGTKLPGPGTIYLAQDLRFRRPISAVEVRIIATDEEAMIARHTRQTAAPAMPVNPPPKNSANSPA